MPWLFPLFYSWISKANPVSYWKCSEGSGKRPPTFQASTIRVISTALPTVGKLRLPQTAGVELLSSREHRKRWNETLAVSRRWSWAAADPLQTDSRYTSWENYTNCSSYVCISWRATINLIKSVTSRWILGNSFPVKKKSGLCCWSERRISEVL